VTLHSDKRSWAIAGPLAVALWVAGIILLTHNGPADDATGAQILHWYRSDTNAILIGGWSFMLGCLAFLCFVAGLCDRLRLPGLVLAGAGMASAFGMLVAAVDVAGAIDKTDIGASTAATFHHAIDLFFVSAELAAIVPLGAVAVVAWRTRALPRWWAAVSGLVAVVLAIGPIGWAALIFGLPVWTLGTALFVLVGTRRRASVMAATA
jgi:hypothetical protein